MSGRLIALGDTHGCLDALRGLLDLVRPQPADRVVTLGDYVDRGSDSRGVVEELMGLAGRCRLIPLLGNHDEMLLEIRHGWTDILDEWLSYGGQATLESYGCRSVQGIPPQHIAFLEQCRAIYVPEEPMFFVHASYEPQSPLDQQPLRVVRWQSIRHDPPGPHVSGRAAIVGHTSQRDGEILDLGHLKCIDTYCYGGKWLTAIDVLRGTVWQVDPSGRPRPTAG